MDRTDIALCKLLLANSRIPIRELADKLDLSVAAVHARIQGLQEAGIVKAFTARLNLEVLGATLVLVWGASNAPSNEEVLARLAKDDHVYWVSFGGARVIYIGTYLRSLPELDRVVSSVTKEAEIPAPTVGILPLGAGRREEPVLERLDCRILRALHRDARKSVTDVAEEIGISSKTVGRRLGRMTREGFADLSMEWYPDKGNDVCAMWELDLRPSEDRGQALALLVNKYEPNLLFTMLFSNLPRSLMIATWTGSMKELRDLHTQIAAEAPFARVVPNVLYTGYLYDTWRDELLMKWAGP